MSNEIKPVHPSESYIMAKTPKKSNQQITSLDESVLAKGSNLAINPEYRKKSEKPLPLNELPHTDPYKDERLRQAKWSFNFALGLTALTPITILMGILLYLTGNVPAATAAGVGGALGGVIVAGRKLYKDANDRLDNTTRNSTEKASVSKDKEESNLD